MRLRFLLVFMLALQSGSIYSQNPTNEHDVLHNIIIILADDLGYGDLSCLNINSKIQTPNLDKLAESGMIFTDAHSSSAVCSPTRYGLLTGRPRDR